MSQKVIYIMGYGRSGTSIVDVYISSALGILGLGEIKHLGNKDFSGDTCACGSAVDHCSTWQRLLKSSSLVPMGVQESFVDSSKTTLDSTRYFIHFLLGYPDACYIHVYRPFIEVLASVWKRSNNSSNVNGISRTLRVFRATLNFWYANALALIPRMLGKEYIFLNFDEFVIDQSPLDGRLNLPADFVLERSHQVAGSRFLRASAEIKLGDG